VRAEASGVRKIFAGVRVGCGYTLGQSGCGLTRLLARFPIIILTPMGAGFIPVYFYVKLERRHDGGP